MVLKCLGYGWAAMEGGHSPEDRGVFLACADLEQASG